MPSTNITFDSETGQQIAILRGATLTIRVTEYVDAPARSCVVPDNPRHACTLLDTPIPMTFDETVSHWTAFLDPRAMGSIVA